MRHLQSGPHACRGAPVLMGPRRPRPLPLGPDAAFEHSATAMAITDAGLRIVAANPAYAVLAGCPEPLLIGSLLPGASPQALAGAPCELAWPGAGGATRTVWMTLSAVSAADGKLLGHVASFTDISALERERQLLRHLAQHDPLTQLPNRRLLLTELDRSIARARRHGQQLALLFVDLDHFKWVNDTLGHAAGDALLQALAQRLRSTLRAEDLVGRWGGDEFIVVLDDPADAAAAQRTAALLLAAIERGLAVAGQCMRVSACVGVALFPDDAQTPADLIRLADAAMYQAKQQGRSRVLLAGQC